MKRRCHAPDIQFLLLPRLGLLLRLHSDHLLPHGPTDTSTNNARQLLTTHRVHHANDSGDEESQCNTRANEQPELNGDVLLLACWAAPVGDLAGVALSADGGRALATVAVLLRFILSLVQELALAVTGAVICELLARVLGVEKGWQDAANSAVALLC